MPPHVLICTNAYRREIVRPEEVAGGITAETTRFRGLSSRRSWRHDQMGDELVHRNLLTRHYLIAGTVACNVRFMQHCEYGQNVDMASQRIPSTHA